MQNRKLHSILFLSETSWICKVDSYEFAYSWRGALRIQEGTRNQLSKWQKKESSMDVYSYTIIVLVMEITREFKQSLASAWVRKVRSTGNWAYLAQLWAAQMTKRNHHALSWISCKYLRALIRASMFCELKTGANLKTLPLIALLTALMARLGCNDLCTSAAQPDQMDCAFTAEDQAGSNGSEPLHPTTMSTPLNRLKLPFTGGDHCVLVGLHDYVACLPAADALAEPHVRRGLGSPCPDPHHQRPRGYNLPMGAKTASCINAQ